MAGIAISGRYRIHKALRPLGIRPIQAGRPSVGSPNRRVSYIKSYYILLYCNISYYIALYYCYNALRYTSLPLPSRGPPQRHHHPLDAGAKFKGYRALHRPLAPPASPAPIASGSDGPLSYVLYLIYFVTVYNIVVLYILLDRNI